jgi:hypothetical protein
VLGGSFRYVRDWGPYGGPHPTITVDQVAVDRAGQGGPFRFVRREPADNTLVRLGPTGDLFVIAGGAPVYVATPSFAHTWFGTWVPPRIDAAMLDGLRPVPADGTVLIGLPEAPPGGGLDDLTGKEYTVRAGVPVLRRAGKLSDLAAENLPAWALVDQVAIDRGGQGGVFDHLLGPP